MIPWWFACKCCASGCDCGCIEDCQVHRDQERDEAAATEERRAAAKRAAGVELYEALSELVDEARYFEKYETGHTNGSMVEALKKARAAIAKAEGKE